MSVDFAIHHEGMAENTGRWVLFVDPVGERLLLCGDDGMLYWRPITDCTFKMAHTPDQPTLVVGVQAPTQNGLVMPEPNRTMRRNGGY